jgi:hypothetical protein
VGEGNLAKSGAKAYKIEMEPPGIEPGRWRYHPGGPVVAILGRWEVISPRTGIATASRTSFRGCVSRAND